MSTSARLDRVLRAAALGIVRAQCAADGTWTFSDFRGLVPLCGWGDAALARNPGRWRALFTPAGWVRLQRLCARAAATPADPPRSALFAWSPRNGRTQRVKLTAVPSPRGACEIVCARAPARARRAASARDALTGIGGPAAWTARARRPAPRPCAVLMADVDRFKRINDTRGHAAGDAALRAVAQTLRNALRRGDAVYRRGGDEFILCLAGCGPDAARGAAERLRRAVEAQPFADAPAGGVRISIGIACAQAGDRLDCVEADADRALRRAKRAGRNCCRMNA